MLQRKPMLPDGTLELPPISAAAGAAYESARQGTVALAGGNGDGSAAGRREAAAQRTGRAVSVELRVRRPCPVLSG